MQISVDEKSVFPEGRTSGGNRQPERHLGPAELDEEPPDLSGEQRGRGLMDHLHPPDHQQVSWLQTKHIT